MKFGESAHSKKTRIETLKIKQWIEQGVKSESAHSKKTRIETVRRIRTDQGGQTVKAPIPRKQGLKLFRLMTI